MRTPVAIVGGGPAGLMLARMLQVAGIASVVLERRSREHVLSRIRAGVLEDATVAQIRAAGIGRRMGREGLVHGGVTLAHHGDALRIDFDRLTGRQVTVYGQTEVTRDLYEALDEVGATVLHEVQEVAIHGADGDAPRVTYERAGTRHRIDCDFVAGCDGFHGVSRRTIPTARLRRFEKVWPFGWMGVLADVPPLSDELIYAGHRDGFALCSMRSPTRSRYYVQCDAEDRPDEWPDQRFWTALAARLPAAARKRLVTGPSIEKSVARLRSFVAEPMAWGRLFLAGDAAHIVPPTGAKGLNLAMADVRLLAAALTRFYREGDETGLKCYSARALARVWKVERFSWWMTALLHRMPEESGFTRRLQRAEFEHLAGSEAMQRVLAENYLGLPDG